METSYKKLLALFMVCIIASCGFHLRGMTNVSFKKISLEGKKISLMEDLRKILIDNKVEIVTNKENPELIIEFITIYTSYKLAPISSLEPLAFFRLIFSMIFSFLLLNETIQINQIISGFIVILAFIYSLNFKKKK